MLPCASTGWPSRHEMCSEKTRKADVAKLNAELRATNVELGATVIKLEEERERYRKLYQQMLEKARRLELGLLGQKSLSSISLPFPTSNSRCICLPACSAEAQHPLSKGRRWREPATRAAAH